MCLTPDRFHCVLEMQAGVERQRAGIDVLAAEIFPLLDGVAIARLDGEADIERVAPERLHRLHLDVGLEALEAAIVFGEFLERDVGAVIAVEFAGGETLHRADGAGIRQHRNAELRHRLVENVGEHHQRLVAGRADRAGAPLDVFWFAPRRLCRTGRPKHVAAAKSPATSPRVTKARVRCTLLRIGIFLPE